MRDFEVEEKLRKELDKLLKKDRELYEAVLSKMDEIIAGKDVDHYKNLRSPLQNFKRVHVKGPFVLIFKYLVGEDKIFFYDLDHHNSIYK